MPPVVSPRVNAWGAPMQKEKDEDLLKRHSETPGTTPQEYSERLKDLEAGKSLPHDVVALRSRSTVMMMLTSGEEEAAGVDDEDDGVGVVEWIQFWHRQIVLLLSTGCLATFFTIELIAGELSESLLVLIVVPLFFHGLLLFDFIDTHVCKRDGGRGGRRLARLPEVAASALVATQEEIKKAPLATSPSNVMDSEISAARMVQSDYTSSDESDDGGTSGRPMSTLETPFQRAVRMLRHIIDHANDAKLRHKLTRVMDQLVEDPASLHVVRGQSLRRVTMDETTRSYFEDLFPQQKTPVGARRSSEQAADNWRKLRMNVAVFSAMKRIPSKGCSETDMTEDLDTQKDTAEAFKWGSEVLQHRHEQVKLAFRSSDKSPHLVSLSELKAASATSEAMTSSPTGSPKHSTLGNYALHGLSKDQMFKVHCLLQNGAFLQWDFDVFDLDAASDGHSLWFASMSVVLHFNLAAALDLDLQRFSAMILCVERSYCMTPAKPNAYHTHIHACDVSLSVMQFCQKADISKNLAGNAAISLFLAAIMHDYRHPGVNNSFLTKTFDSLSLRYNDQSILENFHSAEAFKVMMDPKFDLFREWSGDQVRAFRSTFIKCVLATDLSKSYEYTSKFMAAAASDKIYGNSNGEMLMLEMILKCADVSHPAKPWKIHLKWTELVTEEFFRQGDKEKELGMVISPLCNRAEKNLPKSQCDFIDFIVRPCLTVFSDFCKVTLYMDTLNQNHERWTKMLSIQSKGQTSL